MARLLKDWLTTYLEFTENTEPPKSYHTWVGLSCVAGALQRKCYMRWGHDLIYPNLYVVLIGPSGKCRKGTAMTLGREILADVGVPITAESVTREQLIRAMAEASNSFVDRTSGRTHFHCSITCMSEELSVFLGQNDVKFLANLTDWYDSRPEWKYETKGSGKDHLNGLCFNLLGATAPDWLTSILPQEAVGGGFTSRIVFVVEENKGKTVAEPSLSEAEQELRETLVRDLEHIHAMTGEMRFTGESKRAYVEWYQKQEESIKAGNPPVTDPRFGGYCDRRATLIKKLCMALSASRSDKRIVSLEDFERARKLMEVTERKMPRVFGGMGQSPYAAITQRVIDYIQAHKLVKRSDLMARFYQDMDASTLKIVEDVMEYMKIVRIHIQPGTSEVKYEWRGD